MTTNTAMNIDTLTLTDPEGFYLLVRTSGNSKTGPIPVTTSNSGTCPTGCPFRDRGCYAKGGPSAMAWRRVDAGGGNATPWGVFVAAIRRLPRGTVWRHNQAGDLAVNAAGRVHRAALRALTRANRGKNGFTYTHHPLEGENLEAVAEANRGGFTVNASCETAEQADRAMDAGIPAVMVIDRAGIPHGERRHTPGGRRVVQCPATYKASNLQCATCGGGEPLCQRANRDFVVAFPAHGYAPKLVSSIVGGK